VVAVVELPLRLTIWVSREVVVRVDALTQAEQARAQVVVEQAVIYQRRQVLLQEPPIQLLLAQEGLARHLA
jgi:hypothetical protein